MTSNTTEQNTTESSTERITTDTNYSGDTVITNPEAFTEAVAREIDPWMAPDGEEIEPEVENPHLNDDPRYLRVKAHRSALNFKLIELAQQWGLEVGDVWQHNADKERDMVCMRLDPRPIVVAADEMKNANKQLLEGDTSRFLVGDADE